MKTKKQKKSDAEFMEKCQSIHLNFGKLASDPCQPPPCVICHAVVALLSHVSQPQKANEEESFAA